MTTELINKIKEQVELAKEYEFPFVYISFSLEEASRLIEEHGVTVVKHEQRIYDL